MPAASGEHVIAANHQHNFVKRTGTNTTISAGWTSVPFATLAQGSMVGVSTADNITFTMQPGLWTVIANLCANSTTTDIMGALFEGSNVDPYNAANTEIYSHNSSENVGSTGGTNLVAQIWVPPGATRAVRCSAFAPTGTLRSASPGIPRLTFSWHY